MGEALAAARQRLANRVGQGAPATLRELRLAAGLSQSQLAELTETSQPRIARLEAGREEPGLSTLRKLARALKTDINTVANVFHE